MTTKTTTKSRRKPAATTTTTPKKTGSAVIETTASALRELLAPVLPLTDKGDTLPILECIRLRGHGDKGMTACATDRYRVGMSRTAAITAPEDFEALLPWQSAKAILATFKTTRWADPELKLVFGADVVTVETGGALTDAITGAHIAYRLGVGEYPKSIDTVFGEALQGDGIPSGAAFNAKLLADFAHAARVGMPTQIYGSGTAARPMGIAVGDYFIGALMPVRVDGKGSADGADLDAWQGLVDLTPKPKPDAEKAAS